MKAPFLVVLLTLLVSTQSAYDPSVAKIMAYMSSIAYEPISTINAWSCTSCLDYPLTNVAGFNDQTGSLQCFVGYSAGTGIVLVFRGSSNLDNWIANIDTNKVTYPFCDGCQVHDGFFKSWNDVKSLVMEKLKALRAIKAEDGIYITGHSLGGAMAALAAVEVQDTLGGVKQLITFGEPRAGNEALASYISSKVQCLRVVHNADIVPHIPWMSSGFLHEGTEIWYDEGMVNYQICEGMESDSCSNSLPFYKYGAKDHKIANYVSLPTSLYEQSSNYLRRTLKHLLEYLSGKDQEKQLTVAQQ